MNELAQTELMPAREGALPGEAAVNKELVDAAVHKLNRLSTVLGLELMLKMGDYLLKHFYGDEPENVMKKGQNHMSFRALAEREDLLVSHATLWYAVRISCQYEFLPPDVADRLPVSHHKLLLPVRDQKTKKELAKKAVVNAMTKRNFAHIVQEARQKLPRGSAGGRPPLPGVVKALRKIDRALEEALPNEALYLNLTDEAKEETLVQAKATLQRLGQIVEEMEADCGSEK
jgi:hypothetical protein